MFLLEELRRGASGTMTGFAFTEILVAVFDAWSSGDKDRAECIFDEYLPLIRYENQPVINLSIRKEILRGAELLNAPVRANPLPPSTQARTLKSTGSLRASALTILPAHWTSEPTGAMP